MSVLVLNVSAYRFFPIPNPEAARDALRLAAPQYPTIRGTIIITAEGINLFCAGEPTEVHGLLDDCAEVLPDFRGTPLKESWSPKNPFRKLVIKVRKEAISLGVPTVDPARSTGPRLTPEEFKSWLDRPERDFVLVDTRNDYEVELGTFEGAINPGNTTFRQFPEWVRTHLADRKDATIVTFCTGGIRCEKATAMMMQEGFREVYQIDGGILAYLEATRASADDNHWKGDCFVFDQRVAVDAHLRPTDRNLCYACWHVLKDDELEDPRTVPGESCPYCFEAQVARRQKHEQQREERRAVHHRESVTRGLAARKAYEEGKDA